jgi:hypothetical protein
MACQYWRLAATICYVFDYDLMMCRVVLFGQIGYDVEKMIPNNTKTTIAVQPASAICVLYI